MHFQRLLLCLALCGALGMSGCGGGEASPQQAGNDIRKAAADGDADAVRSMIAKDPSLASQRDPFGITPIHAAAANGRTQIVELLISAKADVNAKDTGGATPLISAAAANHPDTVAALLAHGADVSARGPGGKTAAQIADERGYKEVADALRRK